MTPRPSTGIRNEIVRAAQESYHERGYHGTTLDQILDRAGSTKGTLYYHFASKEALTEVVIRERLLGFVEGFWGRTQWHERPLDYLLQWVTTGNPRALDRGCPVGSLAQEVAFSHAGLRAELNRVFKRWAELIAEGVRAGVRNGTVRPDADPEAVARFYLASFQGLLAMAKVNRGGPDFMARSAKPLVAYLDSLRPEASPSRQPLGS